MRDSKTAERKSTECTLLYSVALFLLSLLPVCFSHSLHTNTSRHSAVHPKVKQATPTRGLSLLLLQTVDYLFIPYYSFAVQGSFISFFNLAYSYKYTAARSLSGFLIPFGSYVRLVATNYSFKHSWVLSGNPFWSKVFQGMPFILGLSVYTPKN